MNDTNIETIYTRLAETIAWCSLRSNVNEPATCLRTPEMTPVNSDLEDPDYRVYNWENEALAQEAILEIAERRSILLAIAGEKPAELNIGLTTGYLAIMYTGANLSDGLSQAESLGFYDGEETPPWDTWLWAFAENTAGGKSSGRYPILLSWCPKQFVPLTQGAIDVNACDCMDWAALHVDNNPFLQTMKAVRLLDNDVIPTIGLQSAARRELEQARRFLGTEIGLLHQEKSYKLLQRIISRS